MLKTALLKMPDVFPRATLQQGFLDMQRGHVLMIRLSDGLLKARVRGDTHQLLDVHLDLKTWPDGQVRCTCQSRTPCRHIAACFFALQTREQLAALDMPDVSFADPERDDEDEPLSASAVLELDEVEWYSNLSTSDHDFFSYQLGILVDGREVNVLPVVLDLLRRMTPSEIESFPDQKNIDLPVANGKRLRLAFGRLRPLLRVLLHHLLRDDQGVSVRPYQLALMREAEDALHATKTRWRGTDVLRQQLQQLTSMTCLPDVAAPKGLMTTLRDYQQQGLNWLHFLKSMQFGGVLADDMGLGKTIQTLALLQHEKEQGRLTRASLIIAPTSLVGNWFEEAARFTPALRVLIFHGTERHRVVFDDVDVVISTYGLIQRDKARLVSYPFYYLILDEAQFIKNARTKTTQIILQLQSTYRLCLTGTPLENHLGELWSLFHFLMPGLLGSAKQFRQLFRLPIEKHADVDRQALLAGRIKPFLLRRTKNDVLRELPPRTDIIQKIELLGPQRDLYEALRLSMEKKVRDLIARQGLGRSHLIVLDALLKLRQVCCDPSLLSLSEANMALGHSAKLDALMALLDNVMEEGRSVLVFSQFTSMLALIEKKLQERHYPYLTLTGKTEDRQTVVRRFQDKEASIFLISLRAGGTGLNLTRADTVILYDPWWNPAVEDQAIGRSHRMGQIQPVFVYRLITSGTVEESMLMLQNKKRGLFEGVFAEQDMQGFQLTEEHLEHFFAPLS